MMRDRTCELRVCVRCGIRYRPRRQIAGLCRDCRRVVAAEELPRWVDA